MALQLRAIATVALVGAAAGAKFTSTHYQDGKCTTQATACVKKESGGWCKPANLKPVPPQIIYFNVDVCENQTFDGSYYGDANFMAGIGAKNPHAKLKCNPSAIGQNIFADDKCTALVPPAKVDSALLASKQTKTDKDFGAGAIVFKQMNPYTALAPGGNCTAQGGKQECCIKLADVVSVDKAKLTAFYVSAGGGSHTMQQSSKMAAEDEMKYLTSGKFDESIKIEWECAGPTSHAQAKAQAAAANQTAPPAPSGSSGSSATISLLAVFCAALVVSMMGSQ